MALSLPSDGYGGLSTDSSGGSTGGTGSGGLSFDLPSSVDFASTDGNLLVDKMTLSSCSFDRLVPLKSYGASRFPVRKTC